MTPHKEFHLTSISQDFKLIRYQVGDTIHSQYLAPSRNLAASIRKPKPEKIKKEATGCIP